MDRPVSHPGSVQRLIDRLTRLPGIGKRSAERLVFHLIKQPPDEARELAAAIDGLQRNVHPCRMCFNLTEGSADSKPVPSARASGSDAEEEASDTTDPLAGICSICRDHRRDHGQVLVVEQPSDVVSFETTGLYRGVYHVLMGRLSPLDGIAAGDLNIDALLERVRQQGKPAGDAGAKDHEPSAIEQWLASLAPVREVILGTNPNLEGDGTALYLSQRLTKAGVKVSRLARGLPTGTSLEAVSKAVLADAIEGRREVGP